jgi:hypothetical protein
MTARKLRRTRRLVLAAALAALASVSLAGAALAVPPGSSTAGSFVIGDQSAQLGAHVTFWGAQWWKQNDLSGGPAPASFKGYAQLTDPSCFEDWTTRPGNSSFPPGEVGEVVSVLVATHVVKSGRVISGDGVQVADVLVDPGYAGNPGHPGTGVVVGLGQCGWGGTF